jgi:hypothetical protein
VIDLAVETDTAGVAAEPARVDVPVEPAAG